MNSFSQVCIYFLVFNCHILNAWDGGSLSSLGSASGVSELSVSVYVG